MPHLSEVTVAAVLQAGLRNPVSTSLDAAGAVCAQVPMAQWAPAASLARDALGLDYFDWLSAVDAYPTDLSTDAPVSLQVVLHVADSSALTRRLLLQTDVTAEFTAGNERLQLASVTGVWAGAAWHERETYEMFGLFFTDFSEGGLSLRHLLLPDDFEGNPLRKSFALAARGAKPWPGLVEPVALDSQDGAVAVPRRPARGRRLAAPGVPDPEIWAQPPSGADAGIGTESSDADG